MTSEEARELRAAIGEVLAPLYAARLGNVAPPDAVQAAIARLHAIDTALLAVVNAPAVGTKEHAR